MVVSPATEAMMETRHTVKEAVECIVGRFWYACGGLTDFLERSCFRALSCLRG